MQIKKRKFCDCTEICAITSVSTAARKHDVISNAIGIGWKWSCVLFDMSTPTSFFCNVKLYHLKY